MIEKIFFHDFFPDCSNLVKSISNKICRKCFTPINVQMRGRLWCFDTMSKCMSGSSTSVCSPCLPGFIIKIVITSLAKAVVFNILIYQARCWSLYKILWSAKCKSIETRQNSVSSLLPVHSIFLHHWPLSLCSSYLTMMYYIVTLQHHKNILNSSGFTTLTLRRSQNYVKWLTPW